MNFEFATATRIIFGSGKFQNFGSLVKSMGNRAMIISCFGDDFLIPLMEQLSQSEISSYTFRVTKEPTITIICEGVIEVQKSRCDFIIGFGGGSAIDTGKAIAALSTNPGNILEYLEVIGSGKPIKNSPLPFVAIPTTSGTGAEVTRNAVLASPEHRAKVSLRSPLMLPELAIIDPELTLSLPPSITASTGLDALAQCIEPFASYLSNPLTDAICREGIYRAADSLQQAFDHGDDLSARTNMSLASLFGGLALANAKLGAVHGFAGVLGGMFPTAPHGVICGRLLPFVMETNIKAIRSREPKNPSLARFDEIAKIVTGKPVAQAVDAVNWIQDLTNKLKLTPLSAFGIGSQDFPTIIEKSQSSSSMKGNPIKLSDEELYSILESAVS